MEKEGSFEPKKLALIRTLQIFNKYSDENHLLKQEDVVKYLKKDYDIVLERKAVGRNISLLKEAGYEFEQLKNGSYIISRPLEDSELKLLIDSVLSSKHITAEHSNDLIKKLAGLSSIHFKNNIKNVYSVNDWNKTDNSQLFYNIDIIDESIEKKVRVKFNYNKYGTNKKLNKTKEHEVSACQLILNNQRYYLMGINEQWHNIGQYRLDKITSIQLTDIPATNIRDLPGYKNGIDYKELSSSFPYMFSDKPQRITLVASEDAIDQVIDWFGTGISITKYKEDGKYKITFKASVKAMEYWALQYLNSVEVLEPEDLRERIKEDLKNAQEKYK